MHACDSRTWRIEHLEDCWEFEASLGYIMSFRLWDPHLNKTKQNKIEIQINQRNRASKRTFHFYFIFLSYRWMYLILKSKLVYVYRPKRWGLLHAVLLFPLLFMFKTFKLRYNSHIRKFTFSMYSSEALVFSSDSEMITHIQIQLVLPK